MCTPSISFFLLVHDSPLGTWPWTLYILFDFSPEVSLMAPNLP